MSKELSAADLELDHDMVEAEVYATQAALPCYSVAVTCTHDIWMITRWECLGTN